MNRFSKVVPRHGALCSALAVLGGTLLCVAAVEAGTTTTVSIGGTVFSGPACVINGNVGDHIEVHFGDTLRTDMINGTNYRQNMIFGLNCTGNPSTLRFKFAGNPGATFDPNVLATNFTDLGVRLLKPDNTPLNLNETFEMTYTAVAPNFMAVPVQNPGAILPTGNFGTSATLTVEVL